MTDPTAAVDLGAASFWDRSRNERFAAFDALRHRTPVSHHRHPEGGLLPAPDDAPGFWAVMRYEDVRHVSRDHKTFCSSQGVLFEDVPPEFLEQVNSFLVLDPPKHTELRRLVGSAFNPKQVRRIEGHIKRRAAAIVDELIEVGDCDFVEQVAARLPMETIWDAWDVPESDRLQLTGMATDLVGWNDPEVRGDRHPAEVMGLAVFGLRDAGLALAADRRRSPGDDLMSELVAASVDGRSLTDEELAGFFVLLAVAGNDTTRHTTSHAMHALCSFPDQRELIRHDVNATIDAAAEEFVRWASPVVTFRRTATVDTELSGQPIAAGDKVVLFYPSANRDESAFERPDAFDVTRDPNRHFGFGGGGAHYCLGASLARTQLRALFGELVTRAPELEVGEPEPLVSNFIDGVKRLPCSPGRPA